jgi:hypothetical protein
MTTTRREPSAPVSHLTYQTNIRHYRGTDVLVTRAVESGQLSHYLEVLDRIMRELKGVHCQTRKCARSCLRRLST